MTNKKLRGYRLGSFDFRVTSQPPLRNYKEVLDMVLDFLRIRGFFLFGRKIKDDVQVKTFPEGNFYRLLENPFEVLLISIFTLTESNLVNGKNINTHEANLERLIESLMIENLLIERYILKIVLSIWK